MKRWEEIVRWKTTKKDHRDVAGNLFVCFVSDAVNHRGRSSNHNLASGKRKYNDFCGGGRPGITCLVQ